MLDRRTTVEELKSEINRFIEEREWHRYHNPKDLSISLSIEAAELLEVFQWRTITGIEKEMTELRTRIEEELADIGIYLLSFCAALDIDLSRIIINKIKRNEIKYPADLYRGKARL